VLYLPKGCWHRAQAIGHSLGLTLAMESVSLLELIQAALLPRLNTVGFRDALPGYASASLAAGMPSELEEIFGSGLEALRRLTDDFSPAKLYAAWIQTEAQAQSMRLRAEKSSATSLRNADSMQNS